MDELTEKFAAVVKEFDALAKSADARLRYCILADALWWSDEMPPGVSDDTLYLFRSLVNYRTKLIIGEPNAAGLPFWLWTKGAFPNWPGFDGDRCKPDETLAAIYRRSSVTGMFPFDLEEIFCALDERFEKTVPRHVIEKRARRTTPPDITAGEIYDLLCRCLSLARKEIRSDAWQGVRDSVSEALKISPELVTKGSWLRQDLGAGR